jgi:hypothetical protein
VEERALDDQMRAMYKARIKVMETFTKPLVNCDLLKGNHGSDQYLVNTVRKIDALEAVIFGECRCTAFFPVPVISREMRPV